MKLLFDDQKLITVGTDDECRMKLQKIQSQSGDWALKYGGYKIIEKRLHTWYTPSDRRDEMVVGDLVAEDFFRDQLEVLPPADVKYENNNIVAFMVGEAYDHVDGEALYATFGTINEDCFVWLGYMTHKGFDNLGDIAEIIIVSDIIK